MPLPDLPPGYQDSAYESLVRSLPGKWFHQLETQESPLYPVLWGLAGALGYVRSSYEAALNAAIPMLSGGPWLSLHLKGLGLNREIGETDEQAKDRYQWEFYPSRNTRAGELAALKHFTGLEPPYIRLEGDRSTNKLGQFRIVLDSADQPWSEIDYGFLGEFISHYVSNGIIPSLDAKLQCLLYQALPAWQFYDQFPMSWNVQGPLWERPAFVTPTRLPFARNLITQVSAPEWRSNTDRLKQLFHDGLVDAPGEIFLYLSDEGHCPNLLVDYDLQLTTANVNQTFPPRPWEVDGWHFYDQFCRFAPPYNTSFFAPFLSVPAGPIVDPFPPLALPELHDIYPDFPSADGNKQIFLQYYGLSFTDFQVVRFFDVAPASTDPAFSSARLQAMQSGPWTLALTEGVNNWGNIPPSGTVLNGTPFTELTLSSIWWTDQAGDARSSTPLWDGQAVYLAMEFVLNKGMARTIRELELRLAGNRIQYRRFSLPIDDQINTGFIFRVRGIGVSTSVR